VGNNFKLNVGLFLADAMGPFMVFYSIFSLIW